MNANPTLLAAFFFLASIGANAQRDERAIRKSNVIRFCHIAWFGEVKNGAKVGPEVELAFEFAKFLNIKSEPKSVLWSDFFKNEKGEVIKETAYVPELFAKSSCDFYAANMTVTGWRESKIAIVPYHAGRIMIVVRKSDAKKYRSVQDLRSKKTIVTANSSLHSELEKLKKVLTMSGNGFEIQTTQVGGTDKALLENKIDFIALDTSQALQVLQKSPDSVSIAFPIGDNQSIGWGFPKKSIWLQTKFVEFIMAQKGDENSRVNQVFRSYYGVSLLRYEQIVQNAQAFL